MSRKKGQEVRKEKRREGKITEEERREEKEMGT